MAGFNMDDYVPVNERIEAFYKKHPDGSLQSEIIEHTETRVTVKAYAYRDRDDERPGTGLSSETIPGATTFTRGSEVENAETSAWGRAIAALGFEVKRGIASREEMRRQQPERGERTPRREAQSPSRSVAPAPVQRSAEEQSLLDELLAVPGMTIARMSLMADAVGVEKGQRATVEQLREMVALTLAEQPSSVPAETDGEAVARAASPATPQVGESLPVATGADSEASGPPAPSGSAPSQPSFEDVLAITGGVDVTPSKPRSTEEAIAAAAAKGRKAKVRT